MGIRHGSAGRFPTRADVILNRFDLSKANILGAGSESTVYAMDAEHVLRIYREHIRWESVEARRAFYEQLAAAQFPFAVPFIYTVGSWVGHVYTVERRIAGHNFMNFVPTLPTEARAQALTNYLDAAAALGNVVGDALGDLKMADQRYGELLMDAPIRHPSWQAYLRARMEQQLATSRADLEVDVPNFADVLAAIYARMPMVGDQPPKRLVHGDFWPGNVMIADNLQISGVVDFSYATLMGDARMDLASATFAVETAPLFTADDVAFLRQQVATRWGDDTVAVIDWYRLYYAIYFSGCKADDPTTYWWCVKNLKEIGSL